MVENEHDEGGDSESYNVENSENVENNTLRRCYALKTWNSTA